MRRFTKAFVSALLPVAVFAAVVQGCGGGGGASAAVAEASAPAGSQGQAPAQNQNQNQTGGNRAPTIRAVGDEYARVGETYAFQPSASDPDGDALFYSAENLPPWASLDPETGRISGTPGPNDEGVYESITITVADVTRHAVTAPFTITVLGDASNGVASLRWEVPMSKVDGSPLDDLAGYRILYGRSSDNLDQSVLINDPSTTSYEFTSLTRGIWYFAVVGVSSSGLEGPPTVVATKSI